MGIFDFFLKGPELKKDEAEKIAFDIALMLHRKQITYRELTINAEKILERRFAHSYPNHSIKPDQSRQILRLAVMYSENDKECLDYWKRRNDTYARAFEEDPYNIPNLSWRNPPIKNVNYNTVLTLFK